MININELEGIWKEADMVSFKVLSWHLPGGTGEKIKNLSQDSWSPDPDLNPRHPEHKGVLST
jgi:hypothetical protein